MAFVLDASIAIAWVVPSQASDHARRIRLKAKREPYHVPAIFAAEAANVLVSLERRGILSADGAQAAADVLARLDPVVHDPTPGIRELRDFANRYVLSAYEASYLALALAQHLPIACSDRPLRKAAARAGVKLL